MKHLLYFMMVALVSLTISICVPAQASNAVSKRSAEDSISLDR